MGGTTTGKWRQTAGGQWLLCLLLWFATGPAQADGITISHAETRLDNGGYVLDADVSYAFSEDVLEALNNGVAITLQLDIRIERTREYVWDETIATLLQRYQLRYHALSDLYIVKHLNSDEQNSYLSLASALRAMGHVRDLPLLDASLLDKHKQYRVRLQGELDTNSLPAPLRPVAWLSGDWQLTSEWYVCPLQS